MAKALDIGVMARSRQVTYVRKIGFCIHTHQHSKERSAFMNKELVFSFC